MPTGYVLVGTPAVLRAWDGAVTLAEPAPALGNEGDVGASTLDRDDFPPAAELLEGAAHGDSSDTVLLRQLRLAWEPSIRRELPGIYVSFDVSGHLDRHSHGRAVIDSGRSVIQGHADHGRYPVTCEDT